MTRSYLILIGKMLLKAIGCRHRPAGSESRAITVGDQMSSASTISKASEKNSSADNAPAEKDMEVTFPLQHYYLPTFPFVSLAEVSRQRTLAEQNKENESNRGFLWLCNSLSFLNSGVLKIPSPDSLNYTRFHNLCIH